MQGTGRSQFFQRDEDALRALGARNYDCAVVAIGGDLATSVVATLNLKELGVQTVVCDYIAGMTDKYAMYKYDELFIPTGWQVRG